MNHNDDIIYDDIINSDVITPASQFKNRGENIAFSKLLETLELCLALWFHFPEDTIST